MGGEASHPHLEVGEGGSHPDLKPEVRGRVSHPVLERALNTYKYV